MGVDPVKAILLSVLLLTACGNTVQITHLAYDDGLCAFGRHGQLFKTELEGPCVWGSDPSGELSTKTVGGDVVAILLGRRISSEQAQQWNIQGFEYCSFQSAGVKIDPVGQPFLLSRPIKDLLVCSELPVSQKVFASYRWD